MMNDSNLDSPQDRTKDVADQNVGRLLTTAYRPEVPSPEFVQRTAQAMVAEANERAAVQMASRTSVGVRIARWSLAASLLVALGVLFGSLWNQAHQTPPADGESFAKQERSDDALAVQRDDQTAQTLRDWPIADALTARPRGDSPRALTLATGDSLRTGKNDRRRVELPDGSILYLNHDTAIVLEAPRRVMLNHGEIFLEVAPRYDDPAVEPNENDRFVVITPDRELVALGTKFNVRADQQNTSVAVVQGRVQVSGVVEPLVAGQEFSEAGDATSDDAIAPIDQATHVIDWTRDLIVAAESPLVPASDYAGGALVAKGPDGQETSLSMRRYHVDVHIEDGFARTTIDQTYFNQETWRMEGTFYFPLPPDASLSRLAMYVNGQLMEGGMAEREHARKTFETIVRKQKDPALLEWIDGSTFRMRVFPLEGRQEKRIVLSYTQRLPGSGDEVQYRFPGGHNMPNVDHWSCRVRGVGAANCDWEADAYDFQASKNGKDLVLEASEEEIKPDRNIVIRLSDSRTGRRRRTVTSTEKPSVRFVQSDHQRHRYLAVRYDFRPTLEPQPRRRDWVFLFEASADRDPILARVQVDVIKTLLGNAERDDTFTILAASSRIRRLANEPLKANPKNIQRATAFLERTQLVGALDLEAAFEAAAADFENVENPCLVHVGSGYPKLGETEHDALIRLLSPGTCYVGVGVGNRWNRALMKQAVGQTGGYFTNINPDESVQWRTIELLSRLNAPRLVDAKVVDDREACQFRMPADVVCQGEELFAVARLDDKATLPEFVEITGRIGDDPFVRRLSVSEVTTGADYLPRTWTKLEIDRMVATDPLAHRDEIVGLSMAMYVMSPFTSLLVLENEDMYEEFNVDRGRKDHWALYPCSEKIDVVHEPLAGPPKPEEPQQTVEAKKQKPSVDAVLQTILVRRPRMDQNSNRSVSVWRLLQPRYVWTNSGQGTFWYDSSAHWARYGTSRLNISTRDEGWASSADNFLAWRSVNLGVPMLDKTPYVSRLFRNAGIGRDTQSLMMMVTPRIIIQEEEELLRPWDLDFERYDWNGLDLGSRRDVNGQATGDRDIDDLIRLVTQTVAPEAWDNVGGPGVITSFPTNLSLVVSQEYNAFSDEDLDFGQQLLTTVYPVGDFILPIQSLSFSADGRLLSSHLNDASIRLWNADQQGMWGGTLPSGSASYRKVSLSRLLNLLDTSADGADLPVFYPDAHVWAELTDRRMRYQSIDLNGHDAASRKVFVALARSTSLDGSKATLAEVVEYLESVHDISIEFDQQALDDLGISRDMPITLKLQDVSLRSVLRLLLRPLDLTYIVRDGIVLVVPDRQLDPFGQVMQDLLAFAPGLHTTRADIQTTLDAEAHSPSRMTIGKIDRRAAKLINGARAAKWHAISMGDSSGASSRFMFDGQGRCRIETRTQLGLAEQILCDGERLWHQYPELGVGAERQHSRFHRAALIGLIPWLLPPTEDLVLGADLRAIDERTVAVVPHASKETQQESIEREHAELRLIFAEDGRLAERQVVQMPSAETVLRETYDTDGTIRTLDKNERELATWRIPIQSCNEPELEPNDGLVIVPMPWRSREHVLAARGMEDNGVFGDWSADDALAVLAAETASGATSMGSTIGWCFLDEGDQRLGFYTLLLAAGVDWTAPEGGETENTLDVRRLIDRLGEHPEEPLARYATAVQGLGNADEPQVIGTLGESNTGLLSQLATLHDLRLGWQQVDPGEAGEKARGRLERQTVRYLRRCRSIPFASATLSLVRQYGGDGVFVRVFEQTESVFQKQTPAAFAVRFQHAQALATGDAPRRALKLLQSLVTEMLDAGFTPMVDQNVKETFFSGDDGKTAWHVLVKQLTDATIGRDASPAALVVARRLHHLGETDAADRIFASVAASGSPGLQTSGTLAAICYLWSTEQQSRAAAMLEPLLDDEELGGESTLWRLAAAMADKRGLGTRATEYLDRALDLEYAHLPDEVEVEQIRTDYRRLLEQYRDAADQLAGAGTHERQRLIARVVRAADRWRSIDPEIDDVCRLTADTLSPLGAKDLAWDYLTSPLAAQAATTVPWYDRGREYHRQGRYDLAERCYAQAFAAEPTNAEILWQRVQVLIESGRRDQAEPLLEQIVEQTWESEYDSVCRQAKRILGRPD